MGRLRKARKQAMPEQAIPEIMFRQKSVWQEADCVNRNGNYNCKNPSTLEAVCGNVMIRCCNNEGCKNVARKMAKSVYIL